MTSRAARVGLALAVAMAMLLALTSPASASTYTYDIGLIRGTITVGTVPFVTPSTPPATCLGSSTINGSLDTTGSTTATDNLTGALNIQSRDFSAPFTSGGRFSLTATGNASGANRGNFNHVTETFTGLHFPTIAFQVRTINTTGPPPLCTLGAVVCSGTATLTLWGGIRGATSLPLTASDEIYVNSSAGSILTTSGCGFPWGLVVFPTTPLSVGPNAGSGDPGAIFHQLT